MRYGCAWYPEHWPEERWDHDLALMTAAGMDVVRIGEFAWSRLEPEAGRFELDWLERAVARAAAHGLATVLATPTAAPPAWLTTAHPEVLRIDAEGRRARHGGRGHADPLHPSCRRHAQRMARALGERFGGSEAVLGWQLDNELADLSHGPISAAAFQEFLRRRFASLERLNQAWSTAYWSQEYSAWEQVPIPGPGDNPGLALAWRDFTTEAWCGYLALQAEAIRAHARPGQFITTNATYEFARQDPHELFADCDLCAVDVYLGSGAPLQHLDMGWMGLYLAAARGVKRAPFWVMETQPGNIDWHPVNPPMDPGEVRRMVYHQVGHGADAVLFWQWRAAPNGQEQYHGCLLGQSGRPRPVYDEVAQAGHELRALAPLLAGTRVRSEVCLLWSNRDRCLLDARRFHQDFAPWRHLRDHYLGLRRLGLDVDVVSPRQGLDGYRCAVAPHLAMVDEELATRLLAWVAAGGVLLLGPRSATRDGHGALLDAAPPGALLGAALGGTVREFYALTEPLTVTGDALTGQAATWGEWLEPTADDCRVPLRYGPGHPWLAGRAALLARRHGRGTIAYLGTWPDEPSMTALSSWLCDLAGVDRPWAPLPEGVEVCQREAPGCRLVLLLNHGSRSVSLRLPWALQDACTGAPSGPALQLPPGEVAVLRRDI